MLGGIGPEATGEFYKKLIERLQEKKLIENNSDYPQIIVNSIPAPELIHDTISNKDLKPYIDGLKELDKLGLDFIVMVCNTIHLFYDRLQNEIKTPILDLREELKRYLVKSKIETATVLGTPTTIKHGLYKFEKIKYLNPTAAEIKQLSYAIHNFNKGVRRNEQIAAVKKICKKYLNKGSEVIVLGCTEFALMLNNKNLPTIDTIDILVGSTINRIRNQKNRSY